MRRFSEQQARAGAVLGRGFHFVAEKTALTRSQWLVLSACVLGPLLVGLIATRVPHAQKAEPRLVASNRTSKDLATTTPTPDGGSPGTTGPQFAPVSAMAAPEPLPAATQPAERTAGGTNPKGATTKTAAAEPPITRSDERGATSTAEFQAATLTRIDSLAKAISRINQKIDDVAAKQKQTSARLSALTRTDAERDDDGADKPAAAAPIPAPRKKPEAGARTATPHVETVEKRPTPRRPTVDRAREAQVQWEVTKRHKIAAAERIRRLHRRRVASSGIFAFGRRW